ncbi:hypothetical protein ALC60_02636 [Trachymyrmex zeteki]|uniref:Uncharacterized protein n=1 Tax=Mycetomoellerius zeteki TaxID=64791 RepID=A0A151XCV9_9HYME|nr:hypothetical protein ALC60_02636 [Trachymyrmex zeteki]
MPELWLAGSPRFALGPLREIPPRKTRGESLELFLSKRESKIATIVTCCNVRYIHTCIFFDVTKTDKEHQSKKLQETWKSR